MFYSNIYIERCDICHEETQKADRDYYGGTGFSEVEIGCRHRCICCLKLNTEHAKNINDCPLYKQNKALNQTFALKTRGTQGEAIINLPNWFKIDDIPVDDFGYIDTVTLTSLYELHDSCMDSTDSDTDIGQITSARIVLRDQETQCMRLFHEKTDLLSASQHQDTIVQNQL